MIAILLIIVVAVVGGVASYFASQFWPRTVFAFSCTLAATGFVFADISAICIAQTDFMIQRLHENGDFNINIYTPYAWLNRWAEPYFLLVSGIFLVIFGVSACLGFATRKMKTQREKLNLTQMSFRENDPYDVATWWFQSLCCEKCGTIQDYDYENPHEVAVNSDQGFHDYAQRAKKAGWIVVAKESPKAEWTILCSNCSPKV